MIESELTKKGKTKLLNFDKSKVLQYNNKYLTIEIFITLGTFTTLLLAWYFTTKFKVISDTLLPSPAKVLKSFNEALFQGYKGTLLLKHLSDSMFRLLSSYGFAILTGIPLGLASGYNSKIRAIFDPLVEFYQSLPPLAYYSILIIWLGIGDFSKIVLLFLAAFAPIFIASMSGVKNVQEDYINGAYTLGAGKGQTFIHVIFPASLPYVFTGLRTSMASAYGTLVAAEMVAGVTGIGWMVSDASRFLRTDIIFMGIIVMGITSVILDRTIRLVEVKVVPWKGKL